jgi:TonB family protein
MEQETGVLMPTPDSPPAEYSELHEVPVLVIQLQDELARSRLREAFWISLVLHLVLIIAAVTSPRWLRFSQPIAVRTPEELIKGKELTYLALPPDPQKVEKPPQTNIISDKNRIASSRRPMLDRKTIEELRDSARPGVPGQGVSARAPQPPAAPPQAQAAQSQAGTQSRPGAQTSPENASGPAQMARVEPPKANPFSVSASPGTSIEQAARAAAGSRVAGYGGSGGDYGLPPPRTNGIQSNLDILSDTMGVDFGPYLSRVLHEVRQNWYVLIPEVARAPLMKKGKVSIEFAILKDGKVSGMRLAGPSGDVSLDRAAWGGITNSNPFPPLPSEFRGSYLALRFHFFYNPDRSDLR